MLPLSDGIRARSFPFVNVALIVANFAVFVLYELPHLNASIYHASFYPCTVTNACHGPEPWGISWFTAMFMHASWDHILGNMLFLAVFGKNVEDAFGHLRYLAFYIAGGFVAMMTQTLMTLLFGSALDGRAPNLGASGAIAAVLGAYFVLYPNSKVLGLIVVGPYLGLVLPWLLVPLPAVRGELRDLQLDGERRRRGRILRARRRVHLRRRRRAAPPQRGAARTAGRPRARRHDLTATHARRPADRPTRARNDLT